MAGKSLGLVAFAIALSTAAALAAGPPAPPEKQQRICRGGARQLGSHMRTPQRCRTEEQWRQEDEARANLPVSLQVTQGQNDGRSVPTPQ
jgi:Spy/CpxP family protein refolding chaperone